MSPFVLHMEQEHPVLLFFYVPWCGICTLMRHELEALSGRMGHELTILKIDVARNTDLATHYGVREVPMLVFLRRGRVQWRQKGMVAPWWLDKKIQEGTHDV